METGPGPQTGRRWPGPSRKPVHVEESSDDILRDHRNHLIFRLAISVALFLPFSLNSMAHGQFWLGVMTLSINLLLLANAISIQRTRRTLYSPGWLFLVIVPVQIYGISVQRYTGLAWHYPAMIFFAFVLERRLSLTLNLVMTILVTPFVAYYTTWQLSSRFLITSLLTVMLVDVFMGNIARLQSQLKAQTLRDPLTGAFNRRYMTERFTQAVARFRRYNVAWSALVLDLDHFKQINDQLGHEAGDRALQAIVQTLTAGLGKLDALFRAGGEEFVLLLESRSEAEALEVAEDLCRTIASAPILPERSVTVSIGVAGLSADDTVEDWLKRADENLYAAKEQGRNRAVCRQAQPATT